MSKAFTKDDDGAGEAPLLLSRRAPLPAGTPNYVTRRGLGLLLDELKAQQASIAAGADAEHRRTLASARRAELENRVASAIVVDSAQQTHERVRFGARVKVRTLGGAERSYRIVGVDEANPAELRIAFVAPLSRSLLGKGIGDVATVKTPAGEDELEILAIDYDAEP